MHVGVCMCMHVLTLEANTDRPPSSFFETESLIEPRAHRLARLAPIDLHMSAYVCPLAADTYTLAWLLRVCWGPELRF